MKQLLVLLSLFVFACNNDNKTTSMDAAPAADSTKGEPLSYAYTAEYSSDFEIGNPKHAQMILALWKDYDNNTLDNSKDYFADSATMIFADGMKISSGRDSILAMAKHHRGMYSAVKSTVDAFMPIRAKDKNENWVGVWGKEVSTIGGKTDSVDLHEIWQIDNNNKVVFVRQFSGKFPKTK